MKFAAVILAGGGSRRMGEDKAKLKIGGRSFTEILASELSGFDELYLSVAKKGKEVLSIQQLVDPIPNAGPLGGLCAGLAACASDAALFVPCDTPLFTSSAGKRLCAALTDEYDGVIAVSEGGRCYPLCAVYRKSALAAFRSTLENGQKKVIDAFSQLRIRQVVLPDEVFTNINDPDDYAKLRQSLKMNILLTGRRGVGKSAVVLKVLSHFDAVPSGFCTAFNDRSSDNRRLCIYPAGEAPSFDEAHTAAFFVDDAPRVTDKFDTLGAEYLAAEGELVVMDEIGKLEENSPKLRLAVKAALDSSTPVLAVVRDGFPGWSAELAAREDADIVTVTEENRDGLPERIVHRLELAGLKRRKHDEK